MLKIVDLPDVCTDYITSTSSRLPVIKCSFNHIESSVRVACVCVCVIIHATNTCVSMYICAHIDYLTGRNAWHGEPRVQVMNSTWVTTRFSSHARASRARTNFSRHLTDVTSSVRMILSQQQHFRLDITQSDRIIKCNSIKVTSVSLQVTHIILFPWTFWSWSLRIYI